LVIQAKAAILLLYLCAFRKEKNEMKKEDSKFSKKVACRKLIFFLNELARYCVHFIEQRRAAAASSLRAKQEHCHLIFDMQALIYRVNPKLI
jgi:hypothetical protein